MKKLIALLLMILPFAGVVSAQEAKIAFVNTQEVFMAMPEVADMQKKLDELNAKYKKELETMQSEFQKKYSDFVAQQDSLTENIKVRRMQDIQDMIIDPQVLLYTGPNAIDATPMVKTKLGLK